MNVFQMKPMKGNDEEEEEEKGDYNETLCSCKLCVDSKSISYFLESKTPCKLCLLWRARRLGEVCSIIVVAVIILLLFL